MDFLVENKLEHTGMNFMEAVKAMKEGKKVIRPDYGEGAYKVKKGNFIGYQGDGELPHFSIGDYEATDWQIYEEEGYYECEKCHGSLTKEDMGLKCRHCGAWTYSHNCYKKGKDNWNLADCQAPWTHVKKISDIKTFIQKVKEDFIGTYKEGKPDCICVKHTDIMNKIIDKRVGRI